MREPRAHAVVAGRHAHQLLQHPPDDAALGVAPAAGEHREDSLKLCLRTTFGPAALPGQIDFLEARAAQPDFFLERSEVLPGRVEECAGWEFSFRLGMGRHAGEQPPQPPRHVAKAPEHADRPLAERLLRRRHQFRRIDAVDVAEAIAGRAGSLRAIEAEELWLRRGVADATLHAGITAREDQIGNWGRSSFGCHLFFHQKSCVPIFPSHDHLAAAGSQGQFHRLGDPAPSGL